MTTTISIDFTKSAARQTQGTAMRKLGLASSYPQAIAMIWKDPTNDFATISNRIRAGLDEAAKLLGCASSDLLTESDLSPLAKLSPAQVVLVLDKIHIAWVIEHFTVADLIDKYGCHQLHQFRKTAKIGREEVGNNLLFFYFYLEEADSPLTEDEILDAYDKYAARADENDLLLEMLKNIARTHFVGMIHEAAMNYIETNSKIPAKQARAQVVYELVLQCKGNSTMMLDTILNAIDDV